MSKKNLIIGKAIEFLKENPTGLRYSDLLKKIQLDLPEEKSATIDRNITKLHITYPDLIEKVSKGFFRYKITVIVPAQEPKLSIEKVFEQKTGLNFNNFYKKYRPKLIWYLTRLSNDPIEAEEITDEGFVKAIDEIAKYDGEKSQFSTWLFTITKRLMIQRLKSKKRFESIQEDHDGASIGDFLIADNRDAAAMYDIAEKRNEIIKRKIPDLPPKYAMVLTMRELDGLTYQEISEALKLNLSTIKSQIRQGRILLRKRIQKDFDKLEINAFWDNYQ